MRRVIFVLLLLILPIQFSWSAASGYCRHETGVAAEHFGHHEHRHNAARGDLAKDTKSTATDSADNDCSVCHLSAAPSIIAAPYQVEVRTRYSPEFLYQLSYRSHIPPGLERPDRRLAARFGESVFSISHP